MGNFDDQTESKRLPNHPQKHNNKHNLEPESPQNGLQQVKRESNTNFQSSPSSSTSSSSTSSSSSSSSSESDDEDEDYGGRFSSSKDEPSQDVKSEPDDSEDEPLSKRVKKLKKPKSEEEEEEEEEEDIPLSKLKKKRKSSDSKSNNKKQKTSSSSSSAKEKESPKKRKKEEEEQHVWKWWEEGNLDSTVKWRTLEHKGPVFAPAYEPLPSHVKFFYDGKVMKLSLEAEEVASFYARMLDHDYTQKTQFNQNFLKDWRKYMKKEEKETITDLKKCDFKQMNEYFKDLSEKRKQMTKEEKQERKRKDEEIQQLFGFCIVDGHKQKIANYKIEPPGLFRGRGEHPKMGKIKKRIEAEDVIINIGKKAKIPDPPKGHKWKEIRHDKTVSWLVSWTENVMNNVKYIMLNPSSKLKSMKDWQKYEKARELAKLVDKIRTDYKEDFKNREMMKRQRAVALYFIDKLALRAGNEKESDETADTVGCCSLRVEHITLHDQKDGKENVVEFDFLGKDSIRYYNLVSVEKRVYKNLKIFMENKQEGDDLFDRLNTATLNKYLNSLMEGLTAKVFRTYNASITLQEQLKKLTNHDMTPPEKMLAYNRANRAVALLCNHQRAVPKTFEKQMENLSQKIEQKKDQIKEVKSDLKHAKKSKNTKDAERLKKRLTTLDDQLKRLEVSAVDKDENKQIALGTSKLNYLDPRISVAWCKKFGVGIEKVYNKTQRDKFRWAIEMVDENYVF